MLKCPVAAGQAARRIMWSTGIPRQETLRAVSVRRLVPSHYALPISFYAVTNFSRLYTLLSAAFLLGIAFSPAPTQAQLFPAQQTTATSAGGARSVYVADRAGGPTALQWSVGQ